MTKPSNNTITTTLIGAGNVAYHLGIVLQQQGVRVHQVFSRKKKKAEHLAKLIAAQPVDQLSDIHAQQDVYILAVHDTAITSVAKQLAGQLDKDSFLVHTSGAGPSTLLAPYFRRYGVFYPLQSFSRDKPVDWQSVPLCIFARYKKDHRLLQQLAEKISGTVQEVNDEQRAQLHLAAVFVNNFTNLCFQIGQEVVSAKNLPFDMLLPLMQQTLDKIKAQPPGHKDPKVLQTGPAIRGDQATIDRHLQLLQEQFPQYQGFYQLATTLLQKKHKR